MAVSSDDAFLHAHTHLNCWLCALSFTEQETAQPLLIAVIHGAGSRERNSLVYFIMLCWAAVIILVSIAFMRRLW